ncbi:hypothetical protein FAD_0906 [Ferroplasma acidiphilum]|uniref:Glycosyltransferase 2-like domain-containing protein n=2 Tax=Ferroplasma acidiphilum TaxID=74969 RepID=A0A1V0N3S6_9ARCH|nr:hypothetical protein FAD_0906 [Ferroplasma acidiphilum]
MDVYIYTKFWAQSKYIFISKSYSSLMAGLPYISVIITAHSRRKYLLNAIKSAVNQTLDKEYYEIIVVKNFNDDLVDDFINKNHIKSIFMNGTIGEFLYSGVTNSLGQVISFLDDDDMFFDNKLEFIYKKFKGQNIAYYHNDHITINENGEPIRDNKIDNIIFNLSSISVMKNVINTENLIRITSNTDDFMYLSALESHKIALKGKERLTQYRFHHSTSVIITDDIKKFIQLKLEFLDTKLNQFKSFRNMFTSEETLSLIDSTITYLEMDMYIFGVKQKAGHIFRIFKNTPESFSQLFRLFTAYILVRLYSKSRNIILGQLWDAYKKSIENGSA